MRRACLLLAVVALVVGCLSQEARSLVTDTAKTQAAFVKRLDEGAVSPEQLDVNARHNAEAWKQLDNLIRGVRP